MRECSIDLTKYDLCDNMELLTILMEYESFHYVKFHRFPKIVKQLGAADRGNGALASILSSRTSGTKLKQYKNSVLLFFLFNGYFEIYS